MKLAAATGAALLLSSLVLLAPAAGPMTQENAEARDGAVVVHDGQKVRAAAVRAEFIRGRWRIVALEIG